jgi:hypothetical protein
MLVLNIQQHRREPEQNALGTHRSSRIGSSFAHPRPASILHGPCLARAMPTPPRSARWDQTMSSHHVLSRLNKSRPETPTRMGSLVSGRATQAHPTQQHSSYGLLFCVRGRVLVYAYRAPRDTQKYCTKHQIA